MIEFQAKVRESGLATVITVPTAYVRDGHIKVGSTYKFTAEEVEPVAQ